MSAVIGPWTITSGPNGCRLVVKSYDGDQETLLRVIEPNTTCEIYLTPLEKKKE